MADNIAVTAGAGPDAAAADDIGGVLYQRIKLVHGADGVNDGDVATSNPLPTQEAGGAMSLLIHLAQARLAALNGAKATATARGDAARVAELDAEIVETETTLAALRGIS